MLSFCFCSWFNGKIINDIKYNLMRSMMDIDSIVVFVLILIVVVLGSFVFLTPQGGNGNNPNSCIVGWGEEDSCFGTGVCVKNDGSGEPCTPYYRGECVCACADLINPNELYCGVQGCVDISNDPLNCGNCIVSCGIGGICTNGNCDCENPDYTFCEISSGSGNCYDLSADPNNCGECGHDCESGAWCISGNCECADQSKELCEGIGCVETDTDPANCGACGNECVPGEDCMGGACFCNGVETCGNEDICCEEGCVDVNNDAANCGGCGVACGIGRICVKGQCEEIFGGCEDGANSGPGFEECGPESRNG
jgi:hypothetical protein